MIRLTRREKSLAVVLAVLTAGWSFFVMVVQPASQRIKTLERVIPQKQAELRKLRATARAYTTLRSDLARLHEQAASREEAVELLPLLESLVRSAGLEKNVATMKHRLLPLRPGYCWSVVELHLEGLTLAELVDFLQRVDSSNLLARTRTLHIKKSRAQKGLLDSVIEIHSPRPSGKTLASK